MLGKQYISYTITHGSQVVMRCSLPEVYQWTEELSSRTNGASRKASLTIGDFFTNATIGEGFLTIGICLCILDMCVFPAVTRFCKFDPFLQVWPIFLTVTHFC